jgi:hypothetical protein
MTNKVSNFGINDLPTAYFCDNVKSNALRNELIKNQVRISECEQGDLEEYFFSDENISLINKQIILSVFNKTKGQFKISEQSSQSLIIVMRYVFLEHAKHLPYNIKQQIRELNCRVVGEILPNIITNITQRIEYLKKIENPTASPLLPLPISTSALRNLPSTTTI